MSYNINGFISLKNIKDYVKKNLKELSILITIVIFMIIIFCMGQIIISIFPLAIIAIPVIAGLVYLYLGSWANNNSLFILLNVIFFIIAAYLLYHFNS